jgi:hypothetical protein
MFALLRVHEEKIGFCIRMLIVSMNGVTKDCVKT